MGRIDSHYVEISARVDKLEKGLKKSENSLKSFGNNVKKIAGAIGVAFGVREIVNFGNEARKLAGEAEGVAAAFARIGGSNYLPALRKATKGTVSDLELMRGAVQAKNFDIPLKDLASLFQFAAKRAQETGQSVEYLTNSIVLGIGRKSPLILDNLGISAIRLRKELKGAGTETATVADVAASVGRIAQQEMSKAGDIIETSAVRSERWASRLQNVQIAIGDGINAVLTEMAPLVDGAFQAFEDGIPKIKQAIIGISVLYNESKNLRAIFVSMGNVTDLLWDSIVLGIKSVADPIKNLGKSLYDLFTGDFRGAVRNAKEIFTETADNFKTFGSDVMNAFKEGAQEVYSPQDKLDLFGLTDKDVAPIIQSAQATAGRVTQAIGDSMASIAPEGSALGAGVIPSLLTGPDGQSGLDETMGLLTDKLGGYLDNVGGFLTGFFEGFAQAFSSGENVLQQFLEYFKKWALGIIAQIAAIAAAAALLSVITGGSFGGLFKGLFGGSSLGQAFGGLKGITQLAKGGQSLGLGTQLTGGVINIALDEHNRKRANSF